MAKNKNKEKKIKIIKESVRTPFKEIGKEKQGEIEHESEEDSENFEEFMSHPSSEPIPQTTGNSPLIQSSSPNQPSQTEENESLEQELENVPSTEEEQEPQLYNAPDYSASYENQETEERTRDAETGFGVMETQSSGIQGTINNAAWFRETQEEEIGQVRQQSREEDYVHAPMANEEEGLPFEERKKKRRRM